MTPDILRHGPFEDLPLPLTPALRVQVEPFARRFVLRGARASLESLSGVFGVPLPLAPLSAATNGSRSALWLGPDEWLLIAENEAENLEAELGQTLEGVFHSLVDVSHRQAAVSLEGPRAQEALNFGVALDLDLAAFPVGMVAKTLFAKAEITLWRQGDYVWHMEFARSFSAYVRTLLLEASREF